VLQSAAADPYSTKNMLKCAEIEKEITRLNEALGPDVDDPQKTKGTAALLAGLAAQTAISSLVLTGAEQHQLRINAAVFAGSIRRGFLKGFRTSKGCQASVRIK
jgi:hypothetical protein